MRGSSGFTLIEVMVVVAIVAILSAIAVPAYTRYIQRGDLVEGTQALSQYRVQMEQYYQDNSNYGTAPACGVTAPTLVNFVLTCVSANAGQTYTATGTGRNQVAGFTYTITQGNVQATTATSWGPTSTTSWIVR
jgi:type IV pilus assembly protein PilE